MSVIKEKIRQKGVTNIMVARMVGIAPTTLSRIIGGKQNPGAGVVIERIIRYLDKLNTDDPTLTQ